MADLVIFPDTALVVIDMLRDLFDERNETAEVGDRVPDPRPDKFVTVNRHGGPKQTLVTDAAQINVESWALTPEAAHDLAQLARAGINAMRSTIHSGIQVFFVNELSGPAELPDPVSDQARYVQSFQVSMRGAAA